MTHKLIVSYGQRAADRFPTRHACTFGELFDWLASMDFRAGEKDGPYLVFADFGTEPKADTNPKSDTFGQLIVGARAYSHLELSYAVPIDLDAGDWTLERIRATLNGYRWIAWTTFKSTPEAPRWRVVVPVSRGMNRFEHRATWEQLNAAFCGQADPAAKDATRLNYLPGPCLHPESATLEWSGRDGALLAPVPAGTHDETSTGHDGGGPVPGWSGPEDDDALIAYALSRRSKAEDAFGAPGQLSKFAALWYGDAPTLAKLFPPTQVGQSWENHSADLALANDLAYYTGSDMERVVRLMNASGLAQRDSWEERKAYRAAEIATRGRTQHAFMKAAPTATASAPAAVAMVTSASFEINARHLCTDQKNAERLYKAYGSQLLSAAGEFYCWVGTHWEGGPRAALRFGTTLSAIIADELKPLRERHAMLQAGADMSAHLANPRKVAPAEEWAMLDELIPELQKWASKSEMQSIINNALGLLKVLLDVPMTAFDADPWLLNVKNGTIDLRTGTLKPHDPLDRITRIIPLEYVPGASAPHFQKFFAEVFPNAETRDYLQKYFGYSITGVNREQTMLVHWGKGSNGKNTLHKAIRHVIGAYAQVGPPGLLTSDKEGQYIHELASLYGARWVSVDENDDGARMKEAAMKQMTGDDNVKGRHLYKSFFEYRPTYKLHLMTNYKPRIVNGGTGVWRRLLLLPYTRQFLGDQVDTTLDAKLEAEAPGLLSWLVAGAARYFAEGLRLCEEMRNASAEYRAEEDMVQQFINDRCALGVGGECPVAVLYANYTGWAKDNGAFALSKKRLVSELIDRPLGITRAIKGHKKETVMVGVKLLAP
jgi:P4 family phage/plasmid primase-like protien